MYIKGEKLIHIPSNKKCTFEEYEVDKVQYYSDDCVWVIFNRIGFKRNVEKLIYLGNIKRR